MGDPGFRFENIAVLQIALNKLGIQKGQAAAYWTAIRERIAADPETASTALVKIAPWADGFSESTFDNLPGLTVATDEIEPEFFNIMQIPLLAGRTFQAFDKATVIVSKRLALRMYGTLDVLGMRYPKAKPEATIVGVVGDARITSFDTKGAQAYSPLNPDNLVEASLIVRARTNPAKLVFSMRKASQAYDERIIPNIRLLRSDYADRVNDARNTSGIVLGLAALALSLSLIGIFGVVSYGASLRQKEIGIRLVLGAGRRSIFRLLLKQLFWPVSLTTIAGTVIGAAASSTVNGDQINAFDPVVLIAVVSIAVLTSAIAGVLPALRVLRIDVADTLRHE